MSAFPSETPVVARHFHCDKSEGWMNRACVEDCRSRAWCVEHGAVIEECLLDRCLRCHDHGLAKHPIYAKGALLLFTTGEYSDYGVGKLMRVVSPFDPEAIDPHSEEAQSFLEAVEYEEVWGD